MSYTQHATRIARDHALTSNYGVHMPTPERGKAFARLIIEGRRRKGWRQEDLVAASGVSRRTLTRWEGGNAERTDPEGVRAVCRALGIDPVDAAIALGYVDHDDDTTEPEDPTLQELIEIFLDKKTPESVKLAALDYLRYLRSNHQLPDAGKGRTAS